MRIIAGELRGRGLIAPAGGARPTTDRVRESILGMVESALARVQPRAEFGTSEIWAEVNVFDFCAGSGALGIEALSRGARFAHFVDRDPKAIATIGQNVRSLGLVPRSRIERCDCRQVVPRLMADLAVIFLDPPYEDDTNTYVAPIDSAAQTGLGTLLVIEHSPKATLASTLRTLTLIRAKKYGGSSVSMFGRGIFADSDVEA